MCQKKKSLPRKNDDPKRIRVGERGPGLFPEVFLFKKEIRNDAGHSADYFWLIQNPDGSTESHLIFAF